MQTFENADRVAISVWGDDAQGWQRIDIELVHGPTFDLDEAVVEAGNIGGEPGQPIRIELLDADNEVLASRETTAA